ncbi:hypothetical protein X275_08635 [Marinitoga sp. 1197]|uniref:hypothetical protein n=1 Tax=Marinitoga sp. 1197 TaxID=1428449 RepID=UPI0006414AAD|nr:hypothetical protein [Marinitoga sp. 1197]KLO21595.1 hypothetical protein X275_08635 [Marinitoga sp. 1197]
MFKNRILKIFLWAILPLNLLFIFYYFYAISVEYEGMFYSYIRLFYNYIPVLITISPFLINQIITYNQMKKSLKPILFLKLDTKEEGLNFKLINYSDNPAFNVEVELEKRNDIYNKLKLYKKKKVKFEKALYKIYPDTDTENKYYIDVISKDTYFSHIHINIRTVIDIFKTYLYDLISKKDLYFIVKIKYYNSEQFYYEEEFNVYFDFDYTNSVDFNGGKNTKLDINKKMNKKEIIHMVENKKIQPNIKITKILRKEIISSKKLKF